MIITIRRVPQVEVVSRLHVVIQVVELAGKLITLAHTRRGTIPRRLQVNNRVTIRHEIHPRLPKNSSTKRERSEYRNLRLPMRQHLTRQRMTLKRLNRFRETHTVIKAQRIQPGISLRLSPRLALLRSERHALGGNSVHWRQRRRQQ